jgi:hypothetical protein
VYKTHRHDLVSYFVVGNAPVEYSRHRECSMDMCGTYLTVSDIKDRNNARRAVVCLKQEQSSHTAATEHVLAIIFIHGSTYPTKKLPLQSVGRSLGTVIIKQDQVSLVMCCTFHK